MIIFDLICQDGAHQFEGWFGSSKDFEQQRGDGMIICPTCGCARINKAVMAPNVGAKGNQAPSLPPIIPTSARPSPEPVAAVASQAAESKSVSKTVQVPAEFQELIGKLAKAQEKMLADSEWVGGDFAERAREIHYGEVEERPIHGEASDEEVAELDDEGIDIAPLPLPITPPESQN